MEKFDRLYQLRDALSGRRIPVSTRQLAEELECTEKTVRRYIHQLRDYYAAPIENIYGEGWRFEPGKEAGWEIPGLWLSAEDIQSLLLLLDILERFGNGLLSPELAAIDRRVDSILAQRGMNRA